LVSSFVARAAARAAFLSAAFRPGVEAHVELGRDRVQLVVRLRFREPLLERELGLGALPVRRLLEQQLGDRVREVVRLAVRDSRLGRPVGHANIDGVVAANVGEVHRCLL